MKIAYLDCFAGISGDMLLGALVDAGLSLDLLRQELRKVPLEGYSLSAERSTRGPLAGTRVHVEVGDTPGEGPHRSLTEVLAIFGASGLSEGSKERVSRVFRRLAEAEAKVHGVGIEEIVFHEVGAVDAMVDVAGAIVGMELLEVVNLYASPLPLAGGYVATGHGTLPLPAPATLELLAAVNAPTVPPPPTARPLGETVTPTGAAILCELAAFQRPSFIVEKVGYGLGSRDHPELPNALRLWLGSRMAGPDRELRLLQTNIDDMNPEIYGYLMERLLAEGALDVWYTPIQMKKNRPGTMISALVPVDAEAAVARLILQETSTLGVRSQPFVRYEAERRLENFETSLGTAIVKIKSLGGRIIGVSPEYEECRRLAMQWDLPLQEVYRRIEGEVQRKLGL